MSNAALVLGCDDYPHLRSDAAPGAVADALAVRSWLLADGGVARHDLRLLLSPLPGDVRDHGVVVNGPADLDCLCAQVKSVLTASSGDRLYVYLTGRCCSSDGERPFLGRPLVLLSDFQPAVAGTGSLAVEELTAHLAHADFREVILVVDCGPGARIDRRVHPGGLGDGWLGRRRVGSAMRFRMQAPADGHHADGGSPAQPRGALTAAFLAAVRSPGAGTNGSAGGLLPWAAVERHVRSLMPSAVTVDGPDPSITLTLTPTPTRTPTPTSRPSPVAVLDDVDADGELDLRSGDPNAMLMVEDTAGVRRAVGVGAIAGHLPAGTYTAVLADPCGTDPRVPFAVTPASTAQVVLSPPARIDGFWAADDPALRWSSPAARLAMATAGIWAHGHQSFLLVGGSPALPGGPELLDEYPDRFPAGGALPPAGSGWWVALPVKGLWHRLAIGGRVLTVPAAPDSVTAVAISPAAVDVALFDTTHPEPTEIAAQDRVQEYLAVGRLGAADLTSRFAVHAGQRWPWGASAAIRRLIDRTRASRAGERPTHHRADDVAAADPPQEFRADVPPVLRPSLVGRGPWAVWLDRQVSGHPAGRQRFPAPSPAVADPTRR
jgi:hypothetical protein